MRAQLAALSLAVLAVGGCSNTTSATGSSAAPSSALPSSPASVPSAFASVPSASAAAVQGCSLLTSAQIAAIIGKDPGAGTQGTNQSGLCTYMIDELGLGIGALPAAQFDQIVAQFKSSVNIDTSEDVPGIGTRAVYLHSPGGGPAGSGVLLASNGTWVALASGRAGLDQLSALDAAILAALG